TDYPSVASVVPAGLVVLNPNEQVVIVGREYVTQFGQLLSIPSFKQLDTAPKNLALMHRLQLPRRGDLLVTHEHLDKPRFQFLHATAEHDAAAVDELNICQDVLDLFNFVRRHDDGAAAVKIVIQQRIVELLPVQ